MKDAAFEKFAEGRSYDEIEAQEVADDADVLTPVQEALVEMRARLGMTQPQLAYRLGVNPVTVCRWETVRPPKGIFLYKLADFAREVEDQAVAAVFDKEILYQGRGTWRGTLGRNAWNARETRRRRMRIVQFKQHPDMAPVWFNADHVAAVVAGQR